MCVRACVRAFASKRARAQTHVCVYVCACACARVRTCVSASVCGVFFTLGHKSTEKLMRTFFPFF